MKKGKFIVVDSGEGAGKTTQIKRAKDLYGDLIVFTREPGGSPYAVEIRKIILESQNAGQADAKTMFALFWAARADHMKNTITPALNNGKIVICDRFDSSTFAYQIVAQGARELEKLFWQIRDFYLGDMKPDLYIYFDIDSKTGLSRKNVQGHNEINHFETRKIEFHNVLRVGFKEFLGHVPHKIIDASQSLEDVWNDFKLMRVGFLNV
ncbi:MAG: dTMP kinase [Flavobacterium sp.]|nr:dTMP kinase [Flavobacterium sp.]